MMKKTKKRLTRLFAVCVCLIIVLSACASAQSGESTVSVTTEESKETSALELSEVNAESTSSETEPLDESSESEPSTPEGHISADSDATLSGDITITPIEPTYPEERETTLEFVKEYPLGKGGIPFALFAGENPEYVMPHVSDWFFADEKGDLYAYNGQRFYNFQTGGTFRPSDESQLIVAEVILGGKWYCMTLDGIMHIYTDQGEKIGSVKYPKISEDGIYTLLVSPDGKLHVEADGVFYDETGKKTAEKYTLNTAKNGGDTLSLFGRTYIYDEDVYVQNYADGVLTACESRDYRMTQCPDGIDHSHIENYNEVIFYQYDKNGDPLSEFMILFYYSSHKIPCNLDYEGMECKEYAPKAVIIGKQRFDNLIDANWFVGADGTIYLMLIDPEGGKLYKITPGYSDVTFTDYEAETTIQQTAARTSTTVIHAKVCADVAEKRADDMCNLIWQVQSEHRLVRAGAALPHHIAKDDYTLTQKGIPYCWGGYNGIDTVSYEVYRGERFEDIITQEASDGRLYMTGNINSVIVSNTIGLDCSGYACSAYGFTSRTNARGFIDNDYGHIVNGALQKMDLLVMADYHCYLFIREYGTTQYLVYDCTRMGEIDKASQRKIDKSDCIGFQFRRLCYTYDPDASSTYHTYSCATCNISRPEPHTFGNFVSISASSHAKICTACGYQTNVQSHTFTYTPDLVGRHAKSCATCGYTATELHTYSTAYSYTTTQHWQTCTRCGTESTRTSHTLSFNHSTTQHWQACGTCGYTARAFAHTYNTYGVCTVCGYRRTAKTTEEPDLPTDDFIVLCVEPKEEFWELVQR